MKKEKITTKYPKRKVPSGKAAGKTLTVNSLTPNPRNPRKITDAKVDQLGKSMGAHGDLSGIVFNRDTGRLATGHQRAKNFDRTAEIVYTANYDKPTKTGTVAEGYILFQGERFSYREVRWSEKREHAAMIAANKNAGEWEMPVLEELIRELSSFDADIDVDTTMFDVDEVTDLLGSDGEGDDGDDSPERGKKASKILKECPNCGHEFTS